MKVSISGVRGIYGRDLNLHEVIKFSTLFANLVKSQKCVLARDTRPSGRIISQVVTAGLMSAGIDIYNLGIAPTPVAFREARKYGAGMIVTASHNPLEWNGLKFIIEGRGLFEREMEQMLSSQTKAASTFGSEHDATSTYVDEVARLAGSGSARVGLDPGGGAACGYAEQLFKKLGMEYHVVNGAAGISSRGPDPTVDELTVLRLLVRKNGLDFGFALDHDSDRLVVVNSAGDKLSPDATLLLCIARTVQMGARQFVASIDTSITIEKYVKSHGGRIMYSKVGEANVVSKMLEVGAEAGGEGSSAGFIMPKFNMCRDGPLAAATIATLDRKVIQECLAFASQFEQVRSKIPADSSLHAKVIAKLPEIFRAESSQLLTEDGIKAVIDDDSWVLVRPSNTEHAIRVSVESRAEKAQLLYKKISEKVQRVYESVK